jgi:hypothetical protein
VSPGLMRAGGRGLGDDLHIIRLGCRRVLNETDASVSQRASRSVLPARRRAGLETISSERGLTAQRWGILSSDTASSRSPANLSASRLRAYVVTAS